MPSYITHVDPDGMRPWPYGETTPVYSWKKRKPNAKKRSAITRDLHTPKYRKRIIPNKKKDVRPEADG